MDIDKNENLMWSISVMTKIRIGIVGYGNLGRGVELAVAANADQELVAVFRAVTPRR